MFLETKPQMVPMDLNISFQGLAWIQGQIYNPAIEGRMTIPHLEDHPTPMKISAEFGHLEGVPNPRNWGFTN